MDTGYDSSLSQIAARADHADFVRVISYRAGRAILASPKTKDISLPVALLHIHLHCGLVIKDNIPVITSPTSISQTTRNLVANPTWSLAIASTIVGLLSLLPSEMFCLIR